MISTTFRTTDSPYTDATPRVHDLSTHFLCVAPAVSTYASADTSTLHSRTQADDEPDRGVLVLKQTVEDGEDRFRINDGNVLAALMAHCDDGNIIPNKPQYGFHSDSPWGPWKAFFDMATVEDILEHGDLLQVEFKSEGQTNVANLEMSKRAIGALKQGKQSTTSMDLSTVHVKHFIRNDTLLNHISRMDLIKGWEDAGFICVREPCFLLSLALLSSLTGAMRDAPQKLARFRAARSLSDGFLCTVQYRTYRTYIVN